MTGNMEQIQNMEQVKSEYVEIDLTPYKGREAQIANLEFIEDFPSNYDSSGTAPVLRVSTGVVDTVEGNDGQKIELRASRIFNLCRREEGGFGWKENSALAEFLANNKLKSPAEMEGMNVVLTIRTKKSKDKKFSRQYLDFI